MKRLLVLDHGEMLTLGDLDAMTDDRLLRSANIGARSRNEIRALIEVMKATCVK